MSLSRISARYAKSLIDLALEQNQLDAVHADIVQLKAACDVRDFLLLCKSPIVAASKKAQIFKAIFEGRFNAMSFGFFNILLKKGREAYIPEITTEFISQYEALKKKTRVILTTAEKMDESLITAIQDKLTKASSTRDHILLDTKIDPALIGGFILEFDDKLYDASVSHQLNQMRKALSVNQ